jgi:hypothetical protein
VKNEYQRTSPFSTETSHGCIRHIELFGDFGTIWAPVKLMARDGRTVTVHHDGGYRMAVPLQRNGRYVYALPGGLEITR